AIFNLNFDRYATPAIVKIVYIILMVISLVAGVFGIISGFVVMFSGRGSLAGAAVFAGLVQVVLSIVLPVVVLAVYRMMLEFYIATIRTSENVQKLVDKFGA
ncbi:MAG: DUF4282 domain-containing protein, partial [Propionibacteriaceae bacterium]|nr:DUF4282 domain-containing protein [Propionibacteriaceae bacterium]